MDCFDRHPQRTPARRPGRTLRLATLALAGTALAAALAATLPFAAPGAGSGTARHLAPAPRAAAAPAPPASPAPQADCDVVDRRLPLPDDADESSGLARSLSDPGVFWTHNDAGNTPHLFAFGTDGRLIGRVRLRGAELVDWEDIETAPCDGGTCLYIGDIGDNDAERDRITIYRVAEPAPDATESPSADALHARYPDGARDAEGLFIDAAGHLYIVAKGRDADIALYRYPAPHRPGRTVTLERVRSLFPPPAERDDRATAASATPDRRFVGIRTYSSLFIYPADALVRGESVEPVTIDLTALGEPQGEGLALDDDGTVWLSTEAGDGDGPGWSRLQCEASFTLSPRGAHRRAPSARGGA